MAKNWYPKSLDELNTEIDFLEFALHIGFQIDKARDSKRTRVLKRADANININYNRPDGQPWLDGPRYRNTNNAFGSDSGRLIQFVQNHCNLDDPQSPIYSASKILHEYLNIPPEIRQANFKKNLGDYSVSQRSKGAMQEVGLDHPNIVALQDDRFLKEWRQLDTSTIERFKDAIRSYKIETAKNQKFFNTAFPLYQLEKNELKVEGFECRNQTQKQNYKSIQGNAYGVWLSTTDFTNVEKICVAESAIDCLAHYELNKRINNNTLYISYSGNLYDAKLKNLNSIIEKVFQESKHLELDPKLGHFMQFKKANLVSIGDNDRKGAENHLRLITNLVDRKLDDKIIIRGLANTLKSEEGKFYQVDVPKTILSKEQASELFNLIDGYNQDLQMKNTGDAKNLYFEYIKVKNLKISPVDYAFIVPNNTEALRGFGKIFAEATNKELFRIQVPKTKDFNDDLKEIKKKINEKPLKKSSPKL